MRALIYLGAGAAAGYALARVFEARAHGLPLAELLSGSWTDPVVTIKLDWLSRQPLVRSNDPNAVLPPGGAWG